MSCSEQSTLKTVFGGSFYWRDPPAGVPPFYTFAATKLGAASGTLETQAPMLTGRAALILAAAYRVDVDLVESCSGFRYCNAVPNQDTLGPIFLEVVP